MVGDKEAEKQTSGNLVGKEEQEDTKGAAWLEWIRFQGIV